MFNDTYYTNKYIAEVGGVSLANINDLERCFMHLIDWNLHITTEEFQFYSCGLQLFTPYDALPTAAQTPPSLHPSPEPLHVPAVLQ